jgi:hypothetical protein
MNRLYVVTLAPKQRHRQAFAAFVWFTAARSEREAVKLFNDLCPQAAGPLDSSYYKRPTAALVSQGGDAIRL